MIFLDGVGIGKEDYQFNPFFKYGFKTFTEIFGKIPSSKSRRFKGKNVFLFPTDARLGVKGFPQSGTGQTAIFTGVNVSKMIGKHFGPYPYSTTIPILEKKNILRAYLDRNQKVCFANAYPQIFFDYQKKGRGRLSCTSLCCRLSGLRLNRLTDLKRGKALTAEITNERWIKKLNYDLPEITPERAAKRLLNIANKNKFTLYEFYLTDHMGHGREEKDFNKLLKNLDDFLYSIITKMDMNSMTLVICSDHGNLEDLSVKTHTLNPSLTIIAGLKAEKLSKTIKILTDIKPAIMKYCK